MSLSNRFSFVFIVFFFLISSASYSQSNQLSGWKTNTEKSLIDLNELKKGGPPKDGIPSIDSPEFITAEVARSWIDDKEPVIAVTYQGKARAYPLQVLIWHEIVNDEINGEPILVTFCPLCYSALAFERTINDKVLEFGVSGFLRHSDLVMYDRKTESLWQQFNGKALVGDYVGTNLEQIPSQIISFAQFRNSYPNGKVLSRNTGYDRNYGTNPYAGYDDIDNTPLFGAGNSDGRLPPMQKVIGVRIGDKTKTYPYSASKKKKIIHDKINDTEIVVFHLDGARSALDAAKLSNSKEDGSTGAFQRVVDGRQLNFTLNDSGIIDRQTGSEWSVTGKAVSGPLKEKQLKPVNSGDYFAFAWLVFWPDTEIYTIK